MSPLLNRVMLNRVMLNRLRTFEPITANFRCTQPAIPPIEKCRKDYFKNYSLETNKRTLKQIDPWSLPVNSQLRQSEIFVNCFEYTAIRLTLTHEMHSKCVGKHFAYQKLGYTQLLCRSECDSFLRSRG